MATEPSPLHVGRTGRAHGLRGELVVKLTTNRLERVEPGSVLIAGDRELVVEASRPHDGGHLVQFAGIADRTAAEAVAHTDLFAAPLDDPEEMWVHDLIGLTVVEADGRERGTVVEVETNPASDLLVLDTGALVPARFIMAITDELIEIDGPDGLFELS